MISGVGSVCRFLILSWWAAINSATQAVQPVWWQAPSPIRYLHGNIRKKDSDVHFPVADKTNCICHIAVHCLRHPVEIN